MNSATHPQIALLAPVPLMHLESGIETCFEEGRVAFGSRNRDCFLELDSIRQGLPVDVYIYASYIDSLDRSQTTWCAEYIGFVDSRRNGEHPQGRRFRPASTEDDLKGHWHVYWEVKRLRKASPKEQIRLTDFISYGKRKRYGNNFIPEGPLLVEHP